MNIFQQSALKDELKRAISDLGFETPTPIQEKTIPEILESDEDLIALAQTGTGKTAGFGLPILQKIDLNKKTVQAVILSPTRELAIQITKDLQNYAKYLPKIEIITVYGGANIINQIRDLKKGVHIVVGTPGRTLDLINRKVLNISDIRWLVLDEADEMLNMGFRDELDAILETTPVEKQTLLFSATMPPEVRQISENYLDNPIEISAGKVNIGAENVEHHYYIAHASDKYLALKRVADINPDVYGLVFCRTREEAKNVASKLIDDGYNADALHGDLSQAQRDMVMQRFRSRQLQMLVATDVAARGLDINDLTHVINYSLPDDPEVYIHRSGRTGRAGKTGISIILANTKEHGRIRMLEKIVGKKFTQKYIPTGQEICQIRLVNLIENIENSEVNEKQIAPFMDTIREKLMAIDKEVLIKKFVSVEFTRFLDYYKNAVDLNIKAEKETSKRKKWELDENEDRPNSRDRNRGKQFSRLFINIGEKNNIKAHNLIGMINEYTDSNNIEVGKIDIQRNFSFFEVEKSSEEDVMEAFKNRKFGKIDLVIEIAKPSQQGERREGGYNRERNDRKPYRKDNDRSYNKSRSGSSNSRSGSGEYKSRSGESRSSKRK